MAVNKAWSAATTVSLVCLSLVEKVAHKAAELIDGSSEVCEQQGLWLLLTFGDAWEKEAPETAIATEKTWGV